MEGSEIKVTKTLAEWVELDEYRNKLNRLHAYLQHNFPAVFEELQKEKLF